jgi:arabinose-5-phosphate isomerase
MHSSHKLFSTPTIAPDSINHDRLLLLAKQTLEIESDAINHVKNRLDVNFIQAVAKILAVQGRIVVMGIGKSGHVGRKIAATFASTGTPAFFVHPTEASHGDLGMITPSDLVLAISNSGASDELVNLLPLIKRMGATLIVMSGNAHSNMARQADIWIDTHVEKEACPLNLAPTASTTVQLALGDALAMCVLDVRGFKSEDFARSHPGGVLGRSLLTHVKDVMRSGIEVPIVIMTASFSSVIKEMSEKGMGLTAVVNEFGGISGIFTDGDLRRLVEKESNLLKLLAKDIMQCNPKKILASALAVDAALLMERHRITSVLVVDERDTLIGVISSNGLMQAKVI